LNDDRGMNVGTVTILIIFMVLCLSVFSTLSFISAYADLKLSQKSALTIGQYYNADAEAKDKIAGIDGLLAPILKQSAGRGAYLKDAGQALSRAEGVTLTAAAGQNPRASFGVPLDDNRTLAVVLEITGSNPDDRYKIASYKVVSNEAGAGDSVNIDFGPGVWDGK